MKTTNLNLENNPTTTTSTFVLPTEVSGTIDKFNNLPTAGKIALGAGVGIVLLGTISFIVWICCRKYRVVRRRQGMQISYPLTPISPGLRRRR